MALCSEEQSNDGHGARIERARSDKSGAAVTRKPFGSSRHASLVQSTRVRVQRPGRLQNIERKEFGGLRSGESSPFGEISPQRDRISSRHEERCGFGGTRMTTSS